MVSLCCSMFFIALSPVLSKLPRRLSLKTRPWQPEGPSKMHSTIIINLRTDTGASKRRIPMVLGCFAMQSVIIFSLDTLIV